MQCVVSRLFAFMHRLGSLSLSMSRKDSLTPGSHSCATLLQGVGMADRESDVTLPGHLDSQIQVVQLC